MDLQSHKADGVLQLAQNFRIRAAETSDTNYQHKMLRTAHELEQLAAEMRNAPIASEGPPPP